MVARGMKMWTRLNFAWLAIRMHFKAGQEWLPVKKAVADLQNLQHTCTNEIHKVVVNRISAGRGNREDWDKMLLIAPLGSDLHRLTYIIVDYTLDCGEHHAFLAVVNPLRMIREAIRKAFSDNLDSIKQGVVAMKG